MRVYNGDLTPLHRTRPRNQLAMFYLPVAVTPGVRFREVFDQWGLDGPTQALALADPLNAPLRAACGRGNVSLDTTVPMVVGGSTPRLHVPISIRLTVSRYLQRGNGTTSVIATSATQSTPLVDSYGMDVCIERNLGAATQIRWVQTTTRLNDPNHGNRPLEFVDGADEGPWTFTAGPRQVFTDTPVAPVPPTGKPTIVFRSTTTLAVRFESRIILAAGICWGFTVNDGSQGGHGMRIDMPRAANRKDLFIQRRILQTGINSTHNPVCVGVDCELPPPHDSVLGPRRATL